MPLSHILLTLLCLMGTLAIFPAPALGAFKSAADVVTNSEQAWNPKPAQDDIILPMPCGLGLAMCPVGVPSGGLLRDRNFTMGISNTAGLTAAL